MIKFTPTTFTSQSLNYAQIIHITAANVLIIQPRVSFLFLEAFKGRTKNKGMQMNHVVLAKRRTHSDWRSFL